MTETSRARNMEVISHVFGTSGLCRQAGRSGVEAIWRRSPDLAGDRTYRAGLAVASRRGRSCWPDLAPLAVVSGTAGSLVGAGL